MKELIDYDAIVEANRRARQDLHFPGQADEQQEVFMDVGVVRLDSLRGDEQAGIASLESAIDRHQAGVKADGGKLPLELVPQEAVEAIAEIMDFGRRKYTEGGWKTVPEAYRRYFAAALRHLGAMQKGELDDPESGKPHVYHALCNLAFLAYFNKRGIACRVFPYEPGE